MALTPAQRKLQASLAADVSWANTADRRARTSPARDGFMDRFRRQVDPDGTLPPEDRERRAMSAMRAHMKRLAFERSKKRAKVKSQARTSERRAS